MYGELVHCVDIHSAVPDVELDIGRGAAEGFSEHQCLAAEVGCSGLVEWLWYYGEE